MLSREDEVKRSRLWRIVMTVSSILIILIAAFFLTKMFRSNPLEGTWKSEDTDLELNVKGNGSMTVQVPEVVEGETVKLKLDYTIDKDEKTVSIRADEEAMEKTAADSDGVLTEDMLESAVSSLLTSFDYSVDQSELTLTEREYGEQMVFTKE